MSVWLTVITLLQHTRLCSKVNYDIHVFTVFKLLFFFSSLQHSFRRRFGTCLLTRSEFLLNLLGVVPVICKWDCCSVLFEMFLTCCHGVQWEKSSQHLFLMDASLSSYHTACPLTIHRLMHIAQTIDKRRPKSILIWLVGCYAISRSHVFTRKAVLKTAALITCLWGPFSNKWDPLWKIRTQPMTFGHTEFLTAVNTFSTHFFVVSRFFCANCCMIIWMSAYWLWW